MEKTAIKKSKKIKTAKKEKMDYSAPKGRSIPYGASSLGDKAAGIEIIEKKEAKEPAKEGRYFEAVGRRKTASARVRLFLQGEKYFLVNDKPYQQYFSTKDLQQIANSALEKMNSLERFRIIARVKGGGIHAQAEAVRHGISRALVEFNADFRKRLRRVGYLTRDPRQRERKKFGLKRARRAPQWTKR